MKILLTLIGPALIALAVFLILIGGMYVYRSFDVTWERRQTQEECRERLWGDQTPSPLHQRMQKERRHGN